MRAFLSHATEDKPRVRALAAALPAHVRPWLDDNELAPGEQLGDELRRAVVEESHAFVVFLSRTALTRPWVATETGWALEHERQLERVFVLPVLLEPGLDLAASPPPFSRLGSRLYLDASDPAEPATAAAGRRLADALFHWASEWLDRIEPEGGGNRRFVNSLRGDLDTYRQRLYELQATLAWPLEVLASRPEALHELVAAKDRYNAFTEGLPQRLSQAVDEVRERFGRNLARDAQKLVDFLLRDVYHGAAFALNDVIESINAYDAVLKDDAAAFAAADARRAERVAALRPVMDELSRRSTEFVAELELEL